MKVLLIRILSFIECCILRKKGVIIGKNVILPGFIHIKKKIHSSIIIEDNVTIHSLTVLNPVLTCRTCLATISPDAQIILHTGCGISGSTLVAVNKIEIGSNTLIGAGCLILDNDMHYPLPDTKWAQINKSNDGKPISIGCGCFIGARSIILKGVSIGDGAVVAAGAVVTKDIPQNYLAYGNPAKNIPLPNHLRH